MKNKNLTTKNYKLKFTEDFICLLWASKTKTNKEFVSGSCMYSGLQF